MTHPATTAAPWTAEQLAELLPPDATHEPTRHGHRAEWTTNGTQWSLSAQWHPTRPMAVTILGPAAAVVLDDPTTEQVQQHLALLGATQEPGNVNCPHPGCPTTTDYVESMDHHLAEHDELVDAWRADTA